MVVPSTAVLIESGDQVPVMPLVDVAGNIGAVEFRHNVPIGSKAGVVLGLTVTGRKMEAAH